MQTEEDRYADLEKPIEDVHNMAAIVARVMEHEAGFEAGDVTISRQSWETFSFAVYHLHELANNLHKRYHRDGNARAA
jgi:NADPH-dependent curcumin reductase CurA